MAMDQTMHYKSTQRMHKTGSSSCAPSKIEPPAFQLTEHMGPRGSSGHRLECLFDLIRHLLE